MGGVREGFLEEASSELRSGEEKDVPEEQRAHKGLCTWRKLAGCGEFKGAVMPERS